MHKLALGQIWPKSHNLSLWLYSFTALLQGKKKRLHGHDYNCIFVVGDAVEVCDVNKNRFGKMLVIHILFDLSLFLTLILNIIAVCSLKFKLKKWKLLLVSSCLYLLTQGICLSWEKFGWLKWSELYYTIFPLGFSQSVKCCAFPFSVLLNNLDTELG